MNVENKDTISNYSNDWKTFQTSLKAFSPPDIVIINRAYEKAKAAHHGQMRVNKEEYFEHLRAVALILLDECGILDPNVIIAALLHDTLEDTKVFGDSKGIAYSVWIYEAFNRITELFGEDAHRGEEIARTVVNLTIPPVDGIEFHDKVETNKFYFENLRLSSPKAILIKMADRLHNLRTQYDMPIKLQVKKVKETKEVYLEIFKTVLDEYPVEGNYLLDEIKFELNKLGESFKEIEIAG